MTYGFCPANWPAFKAELHERGIGVMDIERLEMRPEPQLGGHVSITVTLRSGRVESWTQREADVV
jgi:hypothetical protein